MTQSLVDLLDGAVDLYVHASPDLLPRRTDDAGLARECAAAGYRTAVHRHHFSPTVERALAASTLTGFDLRGAVLLNDAVGGLNPAAVELALTLGGRWIGFPTLSAAFHRAHLPPVAPSLQAALEFGPGQLTVFDDRGNLSAAVRDVLDLAEQADATVNLGYVSPDECRAVIDVASRGSRLVVTNPHTMLRLDPDGVADLVGRTVFVELTAYSMHPLGPSRRDPTDAVDAAAGLIRRIGVDRCLISSDGGMAGAPSPSELLSWLFAALGARGFSTSELRRLSRDNPARIVEL